MRRHSANAIAAALVLLSIPAAAQQVATSAIAVDGGRIDGIALPGGVNAWLGVPFAAPPVRDLRWRAPAPVVKWEGVRHADRFAPECLQPLRGARQNHYFGEEATSEDCLYLNIWAPVAARKAPVVVWIYGGGFNIGSASMANYSGEPLARAGVVRVNIAYRVGALGLLAHPELTSEAGKVGSGNYGLMDQIAALQWVKRNIAKFGGDPDNVTIVGQSAGSMSVAWLQMSPLAKGLFARAVGMSGSPFGGMMAPAPLARAEEQGVALQRELGATSIADLRSVPGDKLVTATTRRDPIVIDNKVVTGRPEDIFARRQQNDVPILIGYTLDESFAPLGPVPDQAALDAAVRRRFGTQAEAILRAYGGASPARAAADIARDATLGMQMGLWATYQRNYGAKPVFAYLFTRRQPYAPGIQFSDHDPATVGAYHSGDVPYWLRTRESLNLFRTTRNWEPGDLALEAEMSGALLAFARGGVPSGAGGNWPAFDPKTPLLRRLAPSSATEPWPHFADLGLFAGQAAPRPSSGGPRD